jgi:hypothetical protein
MLGLVAHGKDDPVSIELFADEGEALAVAWRLQRSGNFVTAFDIAQDGLSRWPDSLPLQHLSILSLASCGSTRAALAAYGASGLKCTAVEDFLTLEARLLKDLAFQSRAAESAPLLVQAAEAYQRIAERTHGPYPTENAALLWALAGNDARATRLAGSVMQDLAARGVPADEDGAYFHWATMAEAALVLRDARTLSTAVDLANGHCRRNLWARTRTIAQMRRLAHLRPDCVDALRRWYVPAVGFVLTADDSTAADEFTALPDNADPPVLVYEGGTDRDDDWRGIAALGADLHVIVPSAPGEDTSSSAIPLFMNRQASGRREGYDWSSLLLDDGEDNERTCAEVGLGLSLGLAQSLHAPWVVLRNLQGRWRQFEPLDRAEFVSEFRHRVPAQTRAPRYALFFADAVGYSTLTASETRHYWTKQLPETGAAILRRHADSLIFRKTWGDAIHGVFRSATAAARTALEMTAATKRLNEDIAAGRQLEFRMALHFGAADAGIDPIEEADSYYGPQLSFAARVVPVVPPGGVFVTEPFAAQLCLEGAGDMDCTYVGATQLAKGYGRVRLLALASRH